MRYASLLCALALGMLTAGNIKAEPAAVLPSMEDFLVTPAVENLRISPDGKHLAYSSRLDDGQYILQVLRIADKAVVGTAAFKGDADVGDIYWVNNTRLVFGIASKRADYERPHYTNALHSIDLDGKNHQILLGEHAGFFGVVSGENNWRGWHLVSTKGGKENTILISDYVLGGDEYPHYFRLNVVEGTAIDIGAAPGRYGSGLADSNGVIRIAHGTAKNGDYVSYYRRSGDAGWEELGRKSRAKGGRDIIGFAKDETELYALETDESGKTSLVRYNPEKKTSEVLLTKPGLDDLQFDADRRTPLYIETDSFNASRHWFTAQNPRAEGIQQFLEGEPGLSFNIVSFSERGGRAVLWGHGSADPGAYYVVDFTTGEVLMRHEIGTQFKGKALALPKRFQIKARDGVELPSVLTQPVQATEKKPPMIVLVHGGPHGVCALPTYDAEVGMLAARGYAVLEVNYRGSGCFGDEFQKKGYRQWGAAMQDDLTDATRWAIEQGYADAQRICIYGGSYGGYAALMGAVREPDLYRCAVGNAGIYDLNLMRRVGDIPLDESGRSYLDEVIGRDKDELKARSPANRAAEIKIPVLLAHGREDQRAPIQQYQAMAAAMKAANKPFVSFVRPSEEHGFYSIKNRREFWTELVAFFDKNTGPASAAARASP